MKYTVTISRDGTWPTVWRWEVRLDYWRCQIIRGEALTKGLARKLAHKAAASYERRVWEVS